MRATLNRGRLLIDRMQRDARSMPAKLRAETDEAVAALKRAHEKLDDQWRVIKEEAENASEEALTSLRDAHETFRDQLNRVLAERKRETADATS